MKPLITRLCPGMRRVLTTALLACACGSSLAAMTEMGRLFYTPAQRAQLETTRVHGTQPSSQRNPRADDAEIPPLRFDGVMSRSDGITTHWVDGKAQVGTSSVSGLKPGQIRANGKIYEPYQILRPTPASTVEPGVKEAAP
jgi:hypothetical protein